MGCYVYPLNEVSAGAKAERVDLAAPAVAFHRILRLHSLFSAEPLRRREHLGHTCSCIVAPKVHMSQVLFMLSCECVHCNLFCYLHPQCLFLGGFYFLCFVTNLLTE